MRGESEQRAFRARMSSCDWLIERRPAEFRGAIRASDWPQTLTSTAMQHATTAIPEVNLRSTECRR